MKGQSDTENIKTNRLMRLSLNLFFSFLFLILAIIPKIANATHMQTGDLSYTYLGNNKYRFVMHIYRDCAGQEVLASQCDITYWKGVCDSTYTQVGVATMHLLSGPTEVTPISSSCLGQTTCNGGDFEGTQMAVFDDTLDLPFTGTCPNDAWHVSYGFWQRDTGITNLRNGYPGILFIEAIIPPAAANINNSAVFTSLPVPIQCVNQPVSFSQGVYDPEGDSLVFSFIMPRGKYASSAPYTYELPYTLSNPLSSSSGFQFNSTNGKMNYTPNIPQRAQFAIKVDEYRNGIYMGSTMRDMQAVIINCGNSNNPTLSAAQNVVGGNVINNVINVCPNTSLSFQFTAMEIDTGVVLTVIDNHIDSIPAATVTYAGTGDTIIGTFTWTPTVADTGMNMLKVIAKGNSCPLNALTDSIYFINVLKPSLCANIQSCFITQNDTSICAGRSVVLTDSVLGIGTYTYLWSTGATTKTIIVSPSLTKTYTVTATAGSFTCTDSVVVSVTSSPPTGLGSISGNDSVCRSAFTYSVGSANGATNYQWTLSGGGAILKGQGTDTIKVQWNTTGTFLVSVVANNICGNSSASILNVTVSDTSALSISPIKGQDTVCAGVANYSVQSSNGATNYNWTVSGAGTITTGQGTTNITVNWTGTGQQIVSVVATNSCASSSTIAQIFYVAPKPTQPTASVLNDTICKGDSTVISGSNSTGGTVTYNFYNSATNGVLLGVSPLKVKPNATTTYYLEVINQYGCVNSGGRLPVTVYVNKAPSITGIGIANDSLCYGDSTLLTANINPIGAIVTWWDSLTGGNNLGTGNTLNTGGLKKTTTYYAQVVSSNGCGSLQTRTAAIVYVEPINSITLISDKPNNIFAAGETVTFTASPSGYIRYDFFVRNVLVQSSSSAIYSSNVLSDNDTVSVRATNNGCSTLKAEVVVHGGDFPNAFTPNGDGKNDLYLKGYDLTILNRWGQELFTGTGGWDGTYNGQRVSPGTYFYIVKLNNKPIKGTVAVIEQ